MHIRSKKPFPVIYSLEKRSSWTSVEKFEHCWYCFNKSGNEVDQVSDKPNGKSGKYLININVCIS
jgi:hypothetical protein